MIYPGATYRPVKNHGGTMIAHTGLVLHVQVGDGSLYGWFDDPGSGVSAHWWVSKLGVVEQYVDSDIIAWAQVTGNATYNSVETEGFPDQPLTPQQINALAGLYRWGHDTYGWPFAISDTPGQRGFAWHGMGGVAWGDHPDCPGDLRKAARTQILQIAAGAVIQPAPPPSPTNPLLGVDPVDTFVALETDPPPGRWAAQYWIAVTPTGLKKLLQFATQTDVNGALEVIAQAMPGNPQKGTVEYPTPVPFTAAMLAGIT